MNGTRQPVLEALKSLALLALLLIPVPLHAEESAFISEFRTAIFKYDPVAIAAIIERNRERIPIEIDAYLAETLKADISADEKAERLYVLERLGTEYKEATGDAAMLISLKKRVFESRLMQTPARGASGGAEVVKMLSTDKEKNIFSPDNLVVKPGATVKWVNNDTTAHLLASVLTAIGKGGIFSPNLEPGEGWEMTFIEPGEYYYVCFIHKVMYGKVTVAE